jgi:hypothetical protein
MLHADAGSRNHVNLESQIPMQTKLVMNIGKRDGESSLRIHENKSAL